MVVRYWKPDRLGLLVAVLTAIIFGLYPPALRGVYANGGNAVFMIIVTMWARALCMTGFCFATHAPLFQSRENIKQAIIGGIFQTLSVFGILGALVYIPGPLVIIIVFTHTLMLLFFMAWRGEIKLDWATVTTTFAALLGLTLVLDIWHEHQKTQWIGMCLAFMSALATVSRLYVYGHQTKTRNPIVVGAENFLVAAVLALFLLIFKTPSIPTSFAGIGYAATSCLSLALGTFGMFYGISLLGSFRWSLFAKLEPVFTALFSVLLLNEILAFQQYMGIALVTGSLAIYQIFGQRQEL